MFCGTSSFRHDADDYPSFPKISKKKSRRNKNPYSSRGLDKFTSVLSELEARREKIMASTGAQGISMIRFMYSNSQDWIPIVVRIDGDHSNSNAIVDASATNKPEEAPASPMVPSPPLEKKTEQKLPALPWWKWRASYCMPVLMVLILVCLVVFGRVFAICCASIWWYLVPTLKGEKGSERNMKKSVLKKKTYIKRLSDKTISPATAAPAAAQVKKMQESGSPRSNGMNRKKG